MGIGLSLFSRDFSRFGDLTLLWIFVACVIFNIIMHVFMSTISWFLGQKTCKKCNNPKSGCICESKKETVTMDTKAGTVTLPESEKQDALLTSDEEKKEECKKPAKGSGFRWFGASIYMGVTVCIAIALLVLIALP